jgi:hypothetical protein
MRGIRGHVRAKPALLPLTPLICRQKGDPSGGTARPPAPPSIYNIVPRLTCKSLSSGCVDLAVCFPRVASSMSAKVTPASRKITHTHRVSKC